MTSGFEVLPECLPVTKTWIVWVPLQEGKTNHIPILLKMYTPLIHTSWSFSCPTPYPASPSYLSTAHIAPFGKCWNKWEGLPWMLTLNPQSSFLSCMFFSLWVYEGQTRIKSFSFRFLRAMQHYPPKLAGNSSLGNTNTKHILKRLIISGPLQVKDGILFATQIAVTFFYVSEDAVEDCLYIWLPTGTADQSKLSVLLSLTIFIFVLYTLPWHTIIYSI